METELTKKIKKAIPFFKPAMPTQMRTIRYAEEVWTPTGICDVVRFEDYIEKDSSFCRALDPTDEITRRFLNGKLGCKINGMTFPNPHCGGCSWFAHRYETGILITCFEVKISVSDFKSKHGHNFHGNYNYYVVPADIGKKVLPLITDEKIGLIVYYPGTGSFRTLKESKFQQIEDELKIRLLYDSLKKWCDGAMKHPRFAEQETLY